MRNCQHFTALLKTHQRGLALNAVALREALKKAWECVCACVAPQGSRCVHLSVIHIPSRRTEQRQSTQAARRSCYTRLCRWFSSFTHTHKHTHATVNVEECRRSMIHEMGSKGLGPMWKLWKGRERHDWWWGSGSCADSLTGRTRAEVWMLK